VTELRAVAADMVLVLGELGLPRLGDIPGPAPQSSRDGRFRHGYFAVAGS